MQVRSFVVPALFALMSTSALATTSSS
ncbi:MAG: hypothetical protein RIS35_3337, partial [Pseudomonadota bacterium]